MKEVFLTWEPLILAFILMIGVTYWACRDPVPSCSESEIDEG